jgi:uroporphyrinogen-III decarboxylase
MTPRERLLATAAFEPVDRPFRMESLGFWDETLELWHAEGLPPEINEIVSATLFFGNDPQLPLSIGDSDQPGFFPAFAEEIIEEAGDYVIKRDVSGSIVKVLASGASTLPSIIEAPVRDTQSWGRVKERLDPTSPGRLEQIMWILDIPGGEDWPMWVYIDGLFGTHRHLLGFTPLMVAYKRQPDLLKEIASHWVFFCREMIAKIADRRRPDAIYIWEDMCYKNGPMIGPNAFDEFMAPYYRDLIGFLKDELEVPVVCVDTDGDLLELVGKYVDAGVNMLVPWEVQAGMDVVAVRRRWPREFVIWGGIDKRALYRDRDAITEEVMRVVPPMLKAGGYIPAIDHVVPPEVTLENWRYFLELTRDLGEKHYS